MLKVGALVVKRAPRFGNRAKLELDPFFFNDNTLDWNMEIKVRERENRRSKGREKRISRTGARDTMLSFGIPFVTFLLACRPTTTKTRTHW